MKLSREEVLKQLSIPDETLSLYEHELEIDTDLTSSPLESFTQEDLNSIRLIHKLRESGLTYNEIKLLTSFSNVLKNVDLEGSEEIKNLLKLSPIYRLKQSLNLARQELNLLKEKTQELEDSLKGEIESRVTSGSESVLALKAEIDTKQKKINSLDRQLSETLLQKAQLETELKEYKEGKNIQSQVKGKKAKELYQMIVQKEAELLDTKRRNEELLTEIEEGKEEVLELKERIDLMEDEALEMEHEVEERYQEQITSLREQIEGLVDKKQKEWDVYYAQINEQRKKELLTLQRRHEQEILKLKQKIKEQIEEIDELRTYKNPLLVLSKIAAKLR